MEEATLGFEYLTNVPLDKAREEYMALLVKNGMAPSSETILFHISRSDHRRAGYARIQLSSLHCMRYGWYRLDAR
jgi:hypothetical protein